jgi:hypothetical protein
MAKNKSRKRILVIMVIAASVMSAWYIFSRDEFCAGCGGCAYEEFTDTVRVKPIVRGADTLADLQLMPINETSRWQYDIDSSGISYSSVNIDAVILIEGPELYEVSGQRIVSGSCAPYDITNISLLDLHKNDWANIGNRLQSQFKSFRVVPVLSDSEVLSSFFKKSKNNNVEVDSTGGSNPMRNK